MHGRGGQVGHLHLAFVPDGERRAAGACVRSQDGELVVEVSGAAEPGAAAARSSGSSRSTSTARASPTWASATPRSGACRRATPGCGPVSFPSPFEAGAWFVLSQRMRAAQAVALKARMTDELGERVAICGEERTAFPAPGVVAELEGLAGLPERKLATLRALAQAAAQGELDGERLRAMGGEAAVEELQRLPGVGPFTAQGIVVRGAGEPDYLATAEPRMAHAAALAYGLDAPLAPEELARRGEAWRPYRSWVGVLLRLGLQDARTNAPRRGRPRARDRASGAGRRLARRPIARALSARYPRSCRPGSRGGRDNPSRKVRTPEGEVVGTPTRGNPRESATETHRRWRGPCELRTGKVEMVR